MCLSWRYLSPCKSWYIIYLDSASQILAPVPVAWVIYVNRSPPVQSWRNICLRPLVVTLFQFEPMCLTQISYALQYRISHWCLASTIMLWVLREMKDLALTCFKVIKILTSFMTWGISWPFLVRILLQATCLWFFGSRARWTDANEPVPKHCEVTIYPPIR